MSIERYGPFVFVVLAAASASLAGPVGTDSYVAVLNYSDPSGFVTPTNPTVELELWVTFIQNPGDRFAGADLDVLAGDGQWSFIDEGMLDPPFTSVGGVGSPTLSLIAGQIHYPPQVIGNPVNPIHIATLSWTTTDFTSRSVNITTFTRALKKYIEFGENMTIFAPELSGVSISVIPAPASVGTFAGIGILALRRRR
ncbi:MAG: hypothetical protein H6815_02750 [Phycisphaeraceae bacterium]|nr:hypothetical protein [Phycisphaerales bacterium]MCB9859346.1 hypothetical protein [Phycisphaeraceae bacterium]